MGREDKLKTTNDGTSNGWCFALRLSWIVVLLLMPLHSDSSTIVGSAHDLSTSGSALCLTCHNK